ncbi:mediator of RNA polymerase II transcription subunit 13 [Nowakowskiella sp. JEL0078]|nr:mediator of RNA polymerase II transcription subunit 13 [Nowakowskiella sp. JEL0078]
MADQQSHKSNPVLDSWSEFYGYKFQFPRLYFPETISVEIEPEHFNCQMKIPNHLYQSDPRNGRLKLEYPTELIFLETSDSSYSHQPVAVTTSNTIDFETSYQSTTREILSNSLTPHHPTANIPPKHPSTPPNKPTRSTAPATRTPFHELFIASTTRPHSPHHHQQQPTTMLQQPPKNFDILTPTSTSSTPPQSHATPRQINKSMTSSTTTEMSVPLPLQPDDYDYDQVDEHTVDELLDEFYSPSANIIHTPTPPPAPPQPQHDPVDEAVDNNMTESPVLEKIANALESEADLDLDPPVMTPPVIKVVELDSNPWGPLRVDHVRPDAGSDTIVSFGELAYVPEFKRRKSASISLAQVAAVKDDNHDNDEAMLPLQSPLISEIGSSATSDHELHVEMDTDSGSSEDDNVEDGARRRPGVVDMHAWRVALDWWVTGIVAQRRKPRMKKISVGVEAAVVLLDRLRVIVEEVLGTEALEGPLSVLQIAEMTAPVQINDGTGVVKYGKFNVKKKKRGGVYGDIPILEPLPTPKVTMRLQQQNISANASILEWWDHLQLEPFGGPKTLTWIALCPGEHTNKVCGWAREVEAMWTACRFGEFVTLKGVGDGGVIGVSLNGMVEPDLWVRRYSEALIQLGLPLMFLILLNIAEPVSQFLQTSTSNLNIFLIPPATSTARQRFDLYCNLAGNPNLTPTTHRHRVVPHTIHKTDHLLTPIRNLCFSLYNINRRNNIYTPSHTLTRQKPLSAAFSLSRNLATSPLLTIERDRVVHVAYRINGSWWCVCWWDELAELVDSRAWHVSNGGGVMRAWRETRALLGDGGFLWRVVVCKNGMWDDEELKEWDQIAQQLNESKGVGTAVIASLTVVNVNPDPAFQVFDTLTTTNELSSATMTAFGDSFLSDTTNTSTTMTTTQSYLFVPANHVRPQLCRPSILRVGSGSQSPSTASVTPTVTGWLIDIEAGTGGATTLVEVALWCHVQNRALDLEASTYPEWNERGEKASSGVIAPHLVVILRDILRHLYSSRGLSGGGEKPWALAAVDEIVEAVVDGVGDEIG